MAIALYPGKRLPTLIPLWTTTPDNTDREQVQYDITEGPRVLLRFMPGVWAPTCAGRDLPRLIDNLQTYADRGIKVFLITRDNPHAVSAWLDMGLVDKNILVAVSDPDLHFTRACGLMIDLSAEGMGHCPTRAAVYAEYGMVKAVAVEASPDEVKACATSAFMAQIDAAIAEMGEHPVAAP